MGSACSGMNNKICKYTKYLNIGKYNKNVFSVFAIPLHPSPILGKFPTFTYIMHILNLLM